MLICCWLWTRAIMARLLLILEQLRVHPWKNGNYMIWELGTFLRDSKSDQILALWKNRMSIQFHMIHWEAYNGMSNLGWRQLGRDGDSQAISYFSSTHSSWCWGSGITGASYQPSMAYYWAWGQTFSQESRVPRLGYSSSSLLCG